MELQAFKGKISNLKACNNKETSLLVKGFNIFLLFYIFDAGDILRVDGRIANATRY